MQLLARGDPEGDETDVQHGDGVYPQSSGDDDDDY